MSIHYAGYTGHVVLDEHSERLPAFYSYVYNSVREQPIVTTYINSIVNDKWEPGSVERSYKVVRA